MTDSPTSQNQNAASPKRILYLTYDGLTDDIGQSQVMPYLSGCAERGHQITVVSFEKRERFAASGGMIQAQCDKAAIHWHPMRFRDRPPYLSKWLDLRDMKNAALRLAANSRFDLVHARSYPSAVAAMSVKRAFRTPILFDMRGFWPDQQRDGQRWKEGTLIGDLLYRRWKAHERTLYGMANHIVVLTDVASHVVETDPGYRGAPISVVPCCADFRLFRVANAQQRADTRHRLEMTSDQPVLGYLGSVGGVYRLDLHLRLLAAIQIRAPNAATLIIGHTPREEIMSRSRELGLNLSDGSIVAIPAARNEVPNLLAAIDVGTCFYIWAQYSRGVSPTKASEFFASGIPVISNDSVGDMPALLRRLDCGMTIHDDSEAEIERAADGFFIWQKQRGASIRAHAQPVLSLDRAVDAYDQIYCDMDFRVRLFDPQ